MEEQLLENINLEVTPSPTLKKTIGVFGFKKVGMFLSSYLFNVDENKV